MRGYVFVVLALLAIGGIQARPEDETKSTSADEKSGEVAEKKADEPKTGEASPVSSADTTAEGKFAEKSGEADSTYPKLGSATGDAVHEKSEGISTDSAAKNPVEGKSSPDSVDSKSTESETLKAESREVIDEKASDKVDENKSSESEKSVLFERTVTSEFVDKTVTDASRSSKDASKDNAEQRSAEASTSTENVQYRSAYGSSSILETKGRSAETEESNSSDIKGRAHVNLRVPTVNPRAVLNDFGSRRMEPSNLMLNLPQSFPPPLHILPNTHPAPFTRFLNPPSVPKVSNLAQEMRTFDDFRQETNAYPYSPSSSQQADALPKLPSLRDFPKLPSYPNNFFKPYDQNFSGNYGNRPRRYTAPDNVNRYAYSNFGYPHYIR